MLRKLIFKNEIKDLLLDYILTRHFHSGQRISIPKIASKLDVSITPVREALTQLSETGIITYIPNRGFFVAELSVKEASEIYDLIAHLESIAIKNTVFTKKQLQELREINLEFIEAQSNMEMLTYDRLFHQKLIENYQNDSAKRIIESLRIKIYLYDYDFWNDDQKMRSIAMHNSLIKYLEDNDIESAVQFVHQNRMQGVECINRNNETDQS